MIRPLTPAPRSTDPESYQASPRPLAAMAKTFPDGAEVAPHCHVRDQFLYGVTGLMRVRTLKEAWIVPPDRAVYLPAGTMHAISIRGQVEMRTVYIASDAAGTLPRSPAVLAVSGLLRNLILALLDEEVAYDQDDRGGAIAKLILSEIVRAARLPLVVPMPDDERLKRLCLAILENPASTQTLEGWSEMAGASARTLARLFATEVGLSFAVWRQRVRFHNALEALARGEPIARVAIRNGYRSASAFAAAFKKAMGQSPTSIRNPSHD